MDRREAPIMDAKMGVVRDIHWESHLVHNLELREVLLMIRLVENLRDHHWESLLVKNM